MELVLAGFLGNGDLSMTATNEELTKGFLSLSNLNATMLEMQATLIELVLPLASHLTEEQRATLVTGVQQGRTLAAGLREMTNHLANS